MRRDHNRLTEQDQPRNFILNCGAHNARYIKDLRKQLGADGSFFIHSFEPNPVYAKGYRNIKNHELHQQALWTYDGTINLYVQEGEKSQGHSLLSNKSNIDPNRFVEVECINFGAWIKKTFNKDDYIVVRMDIEGAEFEVLKSMIEDGSVEYIDRLLVEFHHIKHPETASEQQYQDLISRISIPIEEILH